MNESVLVVDDDPAFREIVTLALEEIGLKVDQVSTGLEALDKVTERKYALVITDLQMPHLDGISFLRELENTDGVKPEVILITANTHWLPKDGPRGVYATFAKPVSASRFLTTVKDAIKKYRA